MWSLISVLFLQFFHLKNIQKVWSKGWDVSAGSDAVKYWDQYGVDSITYFLPTFQTSDTHWLLLKNQKFE